MDGQEIAGAYHGCEYLVETRKNHHAACVFKPGVQPAGDGIRKPGAQESDCGLGKTARPAMLPRGMKQLYYGDNLHE
jgi:hypothetical protein